tara:strand:+ start:413 stop:541 length:129 start_codon:yes stop_codon:yes gene_type:complete
MPGMKKKKSPVMMMKKKKSPMTLMKKKKTGSKNKMSKSSKFQ